MDDAFAELMLTDPEDERPEMTSREARIARAFTESKKSYASEIVVTPPGWFQTDKIQTDDLTKLEARNVEWSVQRLYLQRSYDAAQRLAIDVLRAGGVYLSPSLGGTSVLGQPNIDSGSSTQPGPATLTKNEARDREMLDVAIRCAIKLDNQDVASKLAEATRARWSNSHGLAYTAGEAFLFADKPIDATSALLHAVRARTPSHPVMALLARALHAASKGTNSPQDTAFDNLADLVRQYAERTKPTFDRGLFPGTNAPSSEAPDDSASTQPTHEAARPDIKNEPTPKSQNLPETTIRRWGTEAGLNDVDLGLLVSLCCMGDGAGEDAAGTGERSVKSL
ncbi:hypothetical protein BDV93DRAFT_605879 [Ceratobasidium sp. AG-I]|nr:hypothetical protein BDV93DRAFT_605879 [Ceratobasidium sp. AG-I]